MHFWFKLNVLFQVKKKNRKRNKGISRSNSNPMVKCHTTSLSTDKRHIHSDGCMLTTKRRQHNRLNHACENCDNNSCSVVTVLSKEKRPNGIPLQNLTNGSVIGGEDDKNYALKSKEKFSFKKFLKFQKRDSI